MSNPHHPAPDAVTPTPATGEAATADPAALSDEALADAAGGGMLDELLNPIRPVLPTFPHPSLIPPGIIRSR